MNQIRKVRFQPPISLNPTFLIAKMQQQRFKLIGPYRLEDDTGATIQIGSKHFSGLVAENFSSPF